MASLSVPSEWVAAGTLGSICARHGVPATGARRRTFSTRTPPWVLLLLLVSLLVVLIVSLAIRKQVKGSLPACGRCATEWRSVVAVMLATWALTLVLFVVAAAQQSDVLLVAFGALVLVALVVTLGGDHVRVRGVLSDDRRFVQLSGAHPAFVAATTAALYGQPAPAVHPVAGAAAPTGLTLLPRG